MNQKQTRTGFKVDKELRDQFALAAKDNDLMPHQAHRMLMREYIKKNADKQSRK